MIVDANILRYSADVHSSYTERADDWLTAYLNGETRVPDAELAALAIEHGTPLASADTDFARFTPELTWVNPLA